MYALLYWLPGVDIMKNILLILTGGTIGSSDSGGVISTDKNRCRILELYNEKYGDCRFTVHRPLDILSEDLSLSDWEKLLNYILSLDTGGFDGMIITHGSDTLSWSSAMLTFTLNKLDIPVMITAADLVPDNPQSNALANFRTCTELIGKGENIIRTVYRNPGDSEPTVFIPARMTEADRFTDSFGAVKCTQSDMNKIISDFKCPENIRFEKDILLVHPYPSLDYDDISIKENTGAVLHVTCHSGSISRRALSLLQRCKERNIPFYLCSLKRKNAGIYESADILIQNGAVPLYDITTESAYAKLLLAVNFYPDDINSFMQSEICHEFIG